MRSEPGAPHRRKTNGLISTCMNSKTGKLVVATIGLSVLFAVGCQTQRVLSTVQQGMTEAEVRHAFGAPDEVEPGLKHGDDIVLNWYYYAFANQPYQEWVYVPGARQYGGTYQLIQTSRGVRYRKYRIVFLGGIVISAAELAPPEW